MLASLVAELAAALEAPDRPLTAAASVLCECFGAERASVSEIDTVEGSFEIVASAGAGLLVPGTRLPLTTSSHFAEIAERRTFVAADLEAFAAFGRPLDEVVVRAGFRAGCAVPIVRNDVVVGGIALSFAGPEADVEAKAGQLSVVSGMLAVALARQPPAPGPFVLVIHADELIAHGIAAIVERSAGARTHVTATLDDAVAAIGCEAPDVIVCDPWVSGCPVDEAVAVLRRAGASAPLLVLASHDTPENLAAAVRAGASAYLTRAGAVNGLPLAVSTLRDGRTLLPAESGVALDAHRPLTLRERELVALLDDGLRLKQVARHWGTSEATAKTHTRNLFRKLGATSRTEAVREARRQGLLA